MNTQLETENDLAPYLFALSLRQRAHFIVGCGCALACSVGGSKRPCPSGEPSAHHLGHRKTAVDGDRGWRKKDKT